MRAALSTGGHCSYKPMNNHLGFDKERSFEWCALMGKLREQKGDEYCYYYYNDYYYYYYHCASNQLSFGGKKRVGIGND